MVVLRAELRVDCCWISPAETVSTIRETTSPRQRISYCFEIEGQGDERIIPVKGSVRQDLDRPESGSIGQACSLGRTSLWVFNFIYLILNFLTFRVLRRLGYPYLCNFQWLRGWKVTRTLIHITEL